MWSGSEGEKLLFGKSTQHHETADGNILTKFTFKLEPQLLSFSRCAARNAFVELVFWEVSLEHDLVLLSYMKGKPLRRVHNQMESACIVWKNRKQIDLRLSANTWRQFGKFCESRLQQRSKEDKSCGFVKTLFRPVQIKFTTNRVSFYHCSYTGGVNKSTNIICI